MIGDDSCASVVVFFSLNRKLVQSQSLACAAWSRHKFQCRAKVGRQHRPNADVKTTEQQRKDTRKRLQAKCIGDHEEELLSPEGQREARGFGEESRGGGS